tara:strand:+ start:724 stop:921 length:198 start_codon:yes stop_codon:yes gene_type:complete
MVEAISSLEVGIPLPNKKWSTSKTPSIEDIVVDEVSYGTLFPEFHRKSSVIIGTELEFLAIICCS